MRLRRVQENWDRFGDTDPLWSILTDPQKKFGGWDVDEFFETGRADVRALIDYIDALGLPLKRRRALDFGCGVGRMTQALCEHFGEVVGIDIAPSMIRLANAHNHRMRCRYVLNEGENFRGVNIGRFDLVISHLTLQHLRPMYSLRYLGELIRVLSGGGLLVFDLPSERASAPGLLRRIAPEFLWRMGGRAKRRIRGEPIMEVYGIPRAKVEAVIESVGGTLLDVLPDASAGPAWIGCRYSVTVASAGLDD